VEQHGNIGVRCISSRDLHHSIMQYADAQRWNAVCPSVGFSFANSRTVLLMVLHKHTHNVCWNV
jgi:hypothetical protein